MERKPTTNCGRSGETHHSKNRGNSPVGRIHRGGVRRGFPRLVFAQAIRKAGEPAGGFHPGWKWWARAFFHRRPVPLRRGLQRGEMTPAAYSQVIVHRGERRVKEEVKQDPIGGRDTGCPAGEDLPCDRLESAAHHVGEGTEKTAFSAFSAVSAVNTDYFLNSGGGIWIRCC